MNLREEMEFERSERPSEVMASPVLHTCPEKIWFCGWYEHSILKLQASVVLQAY